MTGERNLVEVVHPRAAERTIGDRETGRLDDMRLDPQAGAKAENRAGILWDVRLVKGDPHGGLGISWGEDQAL
jgi:hypothetical protein